ncbi:MAG TPA: hypothetical protein DEF45_26310 [Rhodopirellula sp.]|nr:hypothetical protein [Rhodopirellula sp.]
MPQAPTPNSPTKERNSQAPASSITEKQLTFFETRIRPVLVEHCYSCHNSTEQQDSDLALDHRTATMKGGNGGPIIVAGDPTASRLVDILKHEIEGVEMPEDGPKLDAKVISDFEAWIRMGAPDPRDTPPTAEQLAATISWEAQRERRKQWWSFQPIAEVPTPNGKGNPIDLFIRSQLADANLKHAPRAQPVILIRRLFLTLTGLPPTRVQLLKWQARYEGKQSYAEITEQLIDTLLASRHFGERWTRHWLDWVRYAESHGSEGDPAIENAWVYRDYLIRALNNDISYDTLVREHIAGDLLPEPRINTDLGINESIIGPSHWRMVFHGFAPTDALDEKVRFIDDQINVFSKAFMGLTISCARCHDHKFDAISQKDYYALFGILASCRPARRVIETQEVQQLHVRELQTLKQKIRLRVAETWLTSLQTLEPRIRDLKKNTDQPADSLSHMVARLKIAEQDNRLEEEWSKIFNKPLRTESKPTDSESGQIWKFSSKDTANDWYAHGVGLQNAPNPAGDFAILAEGDRVFRAIYPAGIYTHSLSEKHGGRLTSRDFKVSPNQEVWIRAIGNSGATTRYVVEDYPRNGTVYPVTSLKPTWTWHRFDMSYWKDDNAHLEVVTAKDAPLLTRNEGRSWFGVREVRLVQNGSPAPRDSPEYLQAILSTNKKTPATFKQVQTVLAQALRDAVTAWSNGSISDAQADLLNQSIQLGLLTNKLQSLSKAAGLVEEYRRLENQIKVPTRVPGLDETRGRTQPLFTRGNHKKPAEIVSRRFLEVLNDTPYATSQSGRLELAEDVLRDDNPFTRRVIVNRIWHHLFGKGISQTPDNFGRLGRQPTHPELLDWLANRFEQDQWSVKSLIRLIVSSETWQQSSTPSHKAIETDPDNELLSHANVRRIEAEAIRDSLLIATGQLDRTMFGKSVSGGTPRRSIYVQVIRNRLDPFLRAFDFPEPFSTTGRRDETNVPAQSLTMMNDPQIHRYAISLAENLTDQKSDEDPESRITHLFQTLFSRDPSRLEISTTQGFLRANQQALTEHRNTAKELQDKITELSAKQDAILAPVRQRLTAKAMQDQPNAKADLKPIASWEFNTDLSDTMHNLNGKANGNASVKGGHLVIKPGGYVTTPPLTNALTAKTLEAWVAVSDLNQRGGGVITIQTPNGVVFDSIVFGEQAPRQWLAGSNGFERTSQFSGPEEQAANDQFVHIAIAYHADGLVVGYRNGKPYGKPYRTKTPVTYLPGKAILSFGVRHLPASGNRLFHGKIDRAALYDRALSDEEIAVSYSESGVYFTQQQIAEALSPEQRATLKQLRASTSEAQEQLDSIGPLPGKPNELQAWIDLTKTMLTLKEFIYVQ